MEREMIRLFQDLETNHLVIEDLGICVNGALLTDVVFDPEENTIDFWAGSLDDDKHAEQIFIEGDTYLLVLEQIVCGMM